MSQVVLTQLLYDVTEVELSLMISIVGKGPQLEVLFWAGELERSGFHSRLWSLVWCIYYDFYASAHPGLAQQLHEWHQQYLKIPNDKSTARAVCNLHARSPRTEVFESRLYNTTGGSVKPRGFQTLHELWTNGTLIEIGSFLYTTDIAPTLLFQSVFASFPGHVLPVVPEGTYDSKHVLMAAITSARLPHSDVMKQLLIIDVPDATIEAMQDIGSFDDTTEYHYLSDRRWVGTNKRLGCFDLPRFSLNAPLTEHLWYHWEYHAALSPVWAARFAKHGGTPDHATKTVVYATINPEDAEEAFFREWNVLPDEQPKTVQAKASGQIIAVGYPRWFRETFGKSPCLHIHEPINYRS